MGTQTKPVRSGDRHGKYRPRRRRCRNQARTASTSPMRFRGSQAICTQPKIDAPFASRTRPEQHGRPLQSSGARFRATVQVTHRPRPRHFRKNVEVVRPWFFGPPD